MGSGAYALPRPHVGLGLGCPKPTRVPSPEFRVPSSESRVPIRNSSHQFGVCRAAACRRHNAKPVSTRANVASRPCGGRRARALPMSSGTGSGSWSKRLIYRQARRTGWRLRARHARPTLNRQHRPGHRKRSPTRPRLRRTRIEWHDTTRYPAIITGRQTALHRIPHLALLRSRRRSLRSVTRGTRRAEPIHSRSRRPPEKPPNRNPNALPAHSRFRTSGVCSIRTDADLQRWSTN